MNTWLASLLYRCNMCNVIEEIDVSHQKNRCVTCVTNVTRDTRLFRNDTALHCIELITRVTHPKLGVMKRRMVLDV